MRALLEYIRQELNQVTGPDELESFCRAICMELLGISQTDYFLKTPVKLSGQQEETLRSAIRRLENGEPLQYVLGTAPFCGLDFVVDRRVLIPRPETAELVGWILEDHTAAPKSVLDVGTGSGCIGITLSSRRPEWSVHACDISEDALQVARMNGQRNGVAVKFFTMDILDPLPGNGKYDIIASNPPYITESEKVGMEANVLGHEPWLALFVPDGDPLKFYRAIAQYGRKTLNEGGCIYFEINPLYVSEMTVMLESLGYCDILVKRDIFGKDRMIKAIYHE